MHSSSLKRPLSESEDEEPENLFPSKDPYPSDDEGVKCLKKMKFIDGISVQKLKQRAILHKVQDSSQMAAHHVQYFFYVDYVPMEEEISLEDASMETCLYHALKFTSSYFLTNEEKLTTEENFKINGKTSKEICENLMQKIPDFTWISNNDKSNFQDLSPALLQEYEDFFAEEGGRWDASNIFKYSRFVKELLDLFKNKISIANVDHNSSKDDNLKRIHHDDYLKNESCEIRKRKMELSQEEEIEHLSERHTLVNKYLEVVPRITSCESFLRSGYCKHQLNLCVQNPDLTEDNVLIEDKNCVITVDPDGLLVGPPSRAKSRLRSENAWLLTMQVYDASREHDRQIPRQNNTTNARCSIIGENIQRNPPSNASDVDPEAIASRQYSEDSNQLMDEGNNIANKKNNIANPAYYQEIIDKIKQSIPSQCLDHCLDQIAGQHFLQLFTMAHESLINNEKTNILIVNNDDDEEGYRKYAKAIGFFIVDEFVYFSKLLVEEFVVHYITNGAVMVKNLPELIELGLKQPRMYYGNFRLDLTIADHRKAFIMFIVHLVEEQKTCLVK